MALLGVEVNGLFLFACLLLCYAPFLRGATENDGVVTAAPLVRNDKGVSCFGFVLPTRVQRHVQVSYH